MDDILDFTRADADSEPVRRHHWLLPTPTRALFVGPSGSGKTNLLLNLVLRPKGFVWDQIFLVGPGLEDQAGYQNLKEVADELEQKAAERHKNVSSPLVSFVADVDSSPTPEDLDPTARNLVVFDDAMLEKQGAAEKLFSRGRHRGADIVYLFQKYTAIPKIVRDNANFLLLFHGVDRDALRRVHSAQCSADMNFAEFAEFFRRSTEEPFSHATVDLTRPPYGGKFRSRFKEWYVPSSYSGKTGGEFVKMETAADADKLVETYLKTKTALKQKEETERCGRQISDKAFEKDFRLLVEPVRSAAASLETVAKSANVPLTLAPAVASGPLAAAISPSTISGPLAAAHSATISPLTISGPLAATAPPSAAEGPVAATSPPSDEEERTPPALSGTRFKQMYVNQIMFDPVAFAADKPSTKEIRTMLIDSSGSRARNARDNWVKWVFREMTGESQAKGPDFERFVSKVKEAKQEASASSVRKRLTFEETPEGSGLSVVAEADDFEERATCNFAQRCCDPPAQDTKIVYLSGPEEGFERLKGVVTAIYAGNTSEALRNEGRSLAQRLLKDKQFSQTTFKKFMSLLE